MEGKTNKPILCRPALRTLPNNINTQRHKQDSTEKNNLDPKNCKTLEKKIKPAHKTTLLKKIEGRYNMDDSEKNSLEEIIFKEDSQKEYIKLLISEEWKYILTSDFLDQTCFSITNRFVLVDWLIKIQQRLNIPDNEFYSTIKIMDSSAKICADPKEGTLLAITSMWIVHKFSNNSVLIPASELASTLDDDFSGKDILAMERKILSAIKFNIRLPEPSIFLEHYLRKIKLNENKDVYLCSFFVCDCLSKFPKFSCVESSFIAAVSLYTTLTVLGKNTCPFLCLMKNLYNEELLRSAHQSCMKKISQIKNMKYHSEPFLKYSSHSRLNISNYFDECDEILKNIN